MRAWGLLILYVVGLVTGFSARAEELANSVDEDVPVVIRGPASISPLASEDRARVVSIQNSKAILATSTSPLWVEGEIVVVKSQADSVGVIAFVSVRSVRNNQDGTYTLTCELVRQSRVYLIQTGDTILHLDLSSENETYTGSTELLVREGDRQKKLSAQYKPLFNQGLSIGETAETLWRDEYMLTWYGQVQYGVRDWLTVGTTIPANFLGAGNLTAKTKLYQSFANVVSTGFTFANVPKDKRSILNLNIYWDSVASESSISHTLLSVALFSFEDAESNTTAIKSLGTSSLQTGTEFILSKWDRVLIGPSYNFELQSVGGYISYFRIWDQFHLSIGLTSTDIMSGRFVWNRNEDSKGGYYTPTFDAYWRF
jgi:hypothetical protein